MITKSTNKKIEKCLKNTDSYTGIPLPVLSKQYHTFSYAIFNTLKTYTNYVKRYCCQTFSLRLHKPSYSAGFSIIELIIVLLVSGIISTIVIPNYTKVQLYAKKNNIKQVGYTLQMAIETYFMENGSYPTDTSIESLISTLSSTNLIKQTPSNAFTSDSFTDNDSSGLITYAYDSTEDSYVIEIFGKNNEESLLILEN